MPMYQHEVGKQLYVFSTSPTGKSKDAAAISAHGVGTLVNGMDKAPKQIRLYFYAPHGFTLIDPSILAVVTGMVSSVIGPELVQDYELCKYQASANRKRADDSNETYASIMQLQEALAEQRQTSIANTKSRQARQVQFKTPLDKVAEMDATDAVLLEKLNQARVQMDVVTIRNRRFHANPRLSWVLKELWAHGYTYGHVHCSFCRGAAGDKNPSGYSPSAG